MLAKDGYTIVIVPHDESSMGRFHINKKMISFLIVTLSLLVLYVGFMSFHYINKKLDHQKLTQLKKENQILKKQLTEFDIKVTKLQEQMNGYVAFDNKIRIMVGYEEIAPDVRNVGIGGTLPVYPEAEKLKSISPELGNEVSLMQKDVDQLLRQAELGLQSFKDIMCSLETREEVWNHTPSIPPAEGFFASGFGFRRDPWTGRMDFHGAIDIANRPGTPIVASADGRVVFADWRTGYGKVVEIDHGYGIRTRYGHCSMLKVKEGDMVKRGEVVAKIGSTGRSTGPHVHYEVWVNGKTVNPMDYILTPRTLESITESDYNAVKSVIQSDAVNN